MVTQEQHDEQTEDIGYNWIDGRMLRLSMDAAGLQYRVVILESGRVIADFATYQNEDAQGGIGLDLTNAVASMVGDRTSERALVAQGWLRGRDVRFNPITYELERVIKPKRTRVKS